MKKETAPDDAQKKKQDSHWLLWWKIEPEELQKQIIEYKTLRFYQSARGISLLLLMLSITMTVVFVNMRLGPYDEYDYFDAALALILGILLYRGHKWAMILAMIYWTFEKAYQIYSSVDGVHPNTGTMFITFIWWSTYMHAFYLAFRTEVGRKKLITAEPAS